MGEVTYIPNGDITSPDISIGKSNILLHCCNSEGIMGAGVAKALYTKWPQVREQYILWKQMTEDGFHIEEELEVENHAEKYQYHLADPGIRQFGLGNVQLVAINVGEESALVANMIGQHNVKSNNVGLPPVRYSAFAYAFSLLSKMAEESEVEICIHVPYLMGCDLAGGEWDIVEILLTSHFVNNNIELKVYDLFDKRSEK